MDESIKIAVTGKGGVGKTTLAALLCKAFSEEDYSVIAVDADPDANLGSALGVPDHRDITPIVDMQELIEERTGAKPGTSGSFFKLNPKVDDLPEKLWKEKDGIRLLRMGTVKKGGGGCICPESTLLKSLVQHLLLYRKEAVILDMEAGIEHLGRATAKSVDSLIVVAEPGRRSIDTALKIRDLAADIKLNTISLVGNKIRSDADRSFIEQQSDGIRILGFLPFDEHLMTADMQNLPPWELTPDLLEQARHICSTLISSRAGS